VTFPHSQACQQNDWNEKKSNHKNGPDVLGVRRRANRHNQ
jgi:hypothetical protein